MRECTEANLWSSPTSCSSSALSVSSSASSSSSSSDVQKNLVSHSDDDSSSSSSSVEESPLKRARCVHMKKILWGNHSLKKTKWLDNCIVTWLFGKGGFFYKSWTQGELFDMTTHRSTDRKETWKYEPSSKQFLQWFCIGNWNKRVNCVWQ